MKLMIHANQRTYPIYIQRNAIQRINDYINTDGKIFLLADGNVPSCYADTILKQCRGHVSVYKIAGGEQSKSLAVYEAVIQAMMEARIDRHSTLIALGGGVTGDLGGFISATYMRGIRFVNIPTTTLAQIDSSIGGKTAINIGHTKNIAGAFYPPHCVIIDTCTLECLPRREYFSGLIEAVKAGLLRNPTLFERFEGEDIPSQIDDIIYEALLVKKGIVEADEFEANERKLLNFGHTIGHALESCGKLHQFLHGEAVAIGMLAMIEDADIKQRLIRILDQFDIPSDISFDADAIYQYIENDKKIDGNKLDIITLHNIGQPQIQTIDLTQIRKYIARITRR